MGFYIRKSKSFGPFRLNLSKSGLGVSAGVKGARVSVGPKGTYFNAGSNGLYYRTKLGEKKKKTRRANARSVKNSYSTATKGIFTRQTLNPKKVISILAILIGFSCFLGRITELKRNDVLLGDFISPLMYLSLFLYGITRMLSLAGNDDNQYSRSRIFKYSTIVLFVVDIISDMHAEGDTRKYSIGFFNTKLGLDLSRVNLNNEALAFIYILLLIFLIVLVISFINNRKSLYDSADQLVELSLDVVLIKKIFIVATVISFLDLLCNAGGANKLSKPVLLICTFALLYIIIIFKVTFDFGMPSEVAKKWDDVCQSFTVLNDSESVFSFISTNGPKDFDKYNKSNTKLKVSKEFTKNYCDISCDCKIFNLKSHGYTYVFYPDQVVVIKGFKAYSFSYLDLNIDSDIKVTTSNLNISDATLFMTRWEHQNIDGSADRRYKTNDASHYYTMKTIDLIWPDFWLQIIPSTEGFSEIIKVALMEYKNYALNFNDENIFAEKSFTKNEPLIEENKDEESKTAKATRIKTDDNVSNNSHNDNNNSPSADDLFDQFED